MGLLDYLGLGGTKEANKTSNTMYEDEHGYFYQWMKMVNGMQGSEKFDPSCAFHTAMSVGEIFSPIDVIASRVSGVDYKVYKKGTDEEVEPKGRLKELLERPNPYMSLSQLVYTLVFSDLSTGGSYLVSKQPDSLKTRATDRIVNLMPLDPDVTKTKLKKEVSNPLLIKSINEVVDKYKTKFLVDLTLQPYEVTRYVYTSYDQKLNTSTPLSSVEKNINNLLAVYSARFNVYDKNGTAGIIARDKATDDLSSELGESSRQDILDDIQAKDGLTGMRNLIGISGVPIKYIETLGKIKDLEPFKETLADAIAIAGALGVDKELIPKDTSTTFSNKESVEIHLWQNKIKPLAEEKAKVLTKALYLTDLEIKPCFDNVAILKVDRKTDAEADKIELENYSRLVELGIKEHKLLDKYGQYTEVQR